MDTSSLETLKKERQSASFFVNEILNEKNSLQKELNIELSPFRPLSAEEEQEQDRRIKRNRRLLFISLILSFIGCGITLHLATDIMKHAIAVSIIGAISLAFFLFGAVIFFFCDFKNFSQLDYEHGQAQENTRVKIKRRKPSKRAIELQLALKEKTIEYNEAYAKLIEIENKIRELEQK